MRTPPIRLTGWHFRSERTSLVDERTVILHLVRTALVDLFGNKVVDLIKTDAICLRGLKKWN
jgi:hypothetical protein